MTAITSHKTTASVHGGTAARTETLGIAAAILAGLALLFVAGISQASVVHGAAHDQRHAISFPCH